MAARILEELVRPLRELDVTDTEFACLKAIVFFAPGLSPGSLPASHTVQSKLLHAQKKFFNNLTMYRYLTVSVTSSSPLVFSVPKHTDTHTDPLCFDFHYKIKDGAFGEEPTTPPNPLLAWFSLLGWYSFIVSCGKLLISVRALAGRTGLWTFIAPWLRCLIIPLGPGQVNRLAPAKLSG